MPKQLLIVESPTKANTIGRYLSEDYVVKSSMGHIRDLPKSKISVDIKNNFEPVYEIPETKKKVVSELRKAIKEASEIWLGTDEDREGEAIAWHLAQILKIDSSKAKRIVFHEITKSAIENAINNPRSINKNLVDAQQARRILDRLVGYELSPVLWKKVRPGLSAGRVQSVAARLIVEREREIEKFKPKDTYKLKATLLSADKQKFSAEGKNYLENKAEASNFLQAASKSRFSVSKLTTAPAVKRPSPPFTTSTLQQTAANMLGFSVKQTMVLAQKLYEAGHITYMRTDSVSLSKSAQTSAIKIVEKNYGKNYVQPRTFENKSKNAQEAHEAIRPTNFANSTAGADERQQKLYKLIWARAMATQMADAKLSKTVAEIKTEAHPEILIAKGEVIVFDGWLKSSPKKLRLADELPKLTEGEKLQLSELSAIQTYSRPKSRYSEASLVKKLESLGIGRPSTYAPTISTIQDRGYVEKVDHPGSVKEVLVLQLTNGKITEQVASQAIGADSKRLSPTQTGIIVTDFLLKNFPRIVDYDFTADIESKFDVVAQGKQDWQKLLAEFYGPFHKTVESSDKISRMEATQGRLLGKDPATGKPVYARLGRFGPMVQLGSADDEQKPKFAPLPKGASLDTVSLNEALSLFEFPKVLGKTESKEEITVNLGPFGPYVKGGGVSASLNGADPNLITLEDAKKLIASKIKQAKDRIIQEFSTSKLQVIKGPYGPYVTDGKKNAKVPKGRNPKKLTEKEAQELLNNKQNGRTKR